MSNSAYNDLKVLHHTEKIEDLIQGRRTSPVYVRMKPTNVCNQNCYYCLYANDLVYEQRRVDRRESIPWEKMQEVLFDMIDMGVKAITLSGGGEPLCYHSIIPTLKVILDSGMDYSVITNGQELKGEKAELLRNAKWIRVSIDATNAKSYEKIRKVATYDSVIQNIKEFAVKKGKQCTLGLNFVVTKDNYDGIYEFCKKMKDIGVDNIKFSPLKIKNDIAGYHEDIRRVVEEQLAKAVQLLNSPGFSVIDKYSGDMLLDEYFEKAYDKCYMKELFTVIAADQKVYYCHEKAYRSDGLIGDIQNQSFKKLWFSNETTELFRKMNAKKECNFRCVFEERNMLINNLINLDENHINFI